MSTRNEIFAEYYPHTVRACPDNVSRDEDEDYFFDEEADLDGDAPEDSDEAEEALL
jgi:hypothetical protein